MAFDWESEDIALTDNEEDEFDPVFEEYALHDNDASCHGILDDQDICNQIRLELEEGYESSENDEGNLEISDHLITKNQALNGIKALKRMSLKYSPSISDSDETGDLSENSIYFL
ncbi:unnamed protein product [Gordionus sp. m RMFG-2023]